MIGQTLAHYEITGSLGAGGMGEVYRATDTRLKRDVAIKVLPAALATDADRLARLEREAQVLAALNHPNIAQIFGIERGRLATGEAVSQVAGNAARPVTDDPPPAGGAAAGGQTADTIALVMELVEGPTLADRIAEGPLPLDEALLIARQIADALEAAHERQIVHRDLKPANVKLKPDGTVKVLDFGIAKAFDAQTTGSGAQTPQLTTPAMTQAGLVLGTAAYMAPEQARGKALDQRADIWAYGCVLYEMLTGQPAFGGEDVPITLARVLAYDADMNAMPATIPATVRQTIELCLRKDPRKRLHAIGDVRLALEGELAVDASPADAPAPITRPVLRRALAPVAALAAGVALAAGAAWLEWPAPAPRPVSRFAYTIPADQLLRGNPVPVFTLAPDGRQFVYNTLDGFYLRALADLEARLIPGSDEPGIYPVFSPDGQAIAYARIDRNTWERIATTGSASVLIGARDNNVPLGATWAADGMLYVAQFTGIFRVPATGGTPELLVAPANGEIFAAPSLLPDGDSLLFSIAPSGAWDAAQIVVQSLATSERTVLLSGGSDPRYVPTGHIVFAYQDGLFGTAFDLKTLTVSGGAVPLVQGVMRATQNGGANYGIASDGTLAYVTGQAAAGTSTLVWVDRDGREAPVAIEPGSYHYPRISPDGRRVALDDRNGDNDDWVWDLAAETRTRLTVGGIGGTYPAWTNDSTRLAHQHDGGIVVAAANNTGTAVTLVPGNALEGGNLSPYFFTPDDSALVFRFQAATETGDDLYIVGADGAGKPMPLLAESYNERNAELSPDGRFMAYQSDESGRYEIYVQPFPNVDDDRVQISNAGGTRPLWSRNGGELFYLTGDDDPDRRLMAVTVEATDARFAFGERRVVLDWPYWTNNAGRTYDVAADGERFLAIKEDAVAATETEIVVVQNWTEELKRLVPTD